MLTFAWPAAPATAVEEVPGGNVIPDKPGGVVPPTARPTATPTATQPAVPDVGENEGGLPNGQPTPTRTTGGAGATPTPDTGLSEFERLNDLARNRIIFHAATPVQLSKVDEGGLQVYFVGRNGKTRLGPWIPPFNSLAAMHPDGEETSLYLGYNPLTGKRVKIDYLPSVNRIRVDTFYADREYDKNKPYIFHFGPDHDITYDVW